MFELIYCSNALPGISEQDINAILATSREFNAKNSLTGCLLYHRAEFIQILEGDKGVVKDLYNNIVADKRHTDVILLKEGKKESRSFSNWSMAYHEIVQDDLNAVNESLFINNMLAFSQFAIKPSEATKLFWYMTKQLLNEN